jgi:hypothetical protein
MQILLLERAVNLESSKLLETEMSISILNMKLEFISKIASNFYLNFRV